MGSPKTQQARANLQSNLQKAQSARALQLMNERDFDKRADGVNAALPEALHGDLDPIRIIKQEKPVHRTMVNMAAAGYQNNEIAAALDRSQQTVATVLKQPWARDYLINQAKKTVQDEIKAVLEAEALPSIRKLVAVRDGQDVSAQNVIAASNSLLDRFLGKPTQPITTDAKPMSELSDAELKEQVQRELATN